MKFYTAKEADYISLEFPESGGGGVGWGGVGLGGQGVIELIC